MRSIYRNFDLRFARSDAGYRVEVRDAPAGEALGSFVPPLGDDELAEQLGFLRPGGSPARNLVVDAATQEAPRSAVQKALVSCASAVEIGDDLGAGRACRTHKSTYASQLRGSQSLPDNSRTRHQPQVRTRAGHAYRHGWIRPTGAQQDVAARVIRSLVMSS
jgi:hypothetical protein